MIKAVYQMMCIMVSVLHKYTYTHIHEENTGRKHDRNLIHCMVVISGDGIVSDFSFLLTCNF